ncbi:MAG TPA: polyphosphate kinase 2 family protein [Bryocella sp.]|nr:polyphosphate kinase 2 family protein [Bryocella sp.]
MKSLQSVAQRYRIESGKGFRLKDYDPGDTWHFQSKEDADPTLEKGLAQLVELQDRLYAQDRWALLLVLQGMDAAGKDSVVKHVMSGVNPQGCVVSSFKPPSEEELDHDYLWRAGKRLPARGEIGIFNRSYYEEALVVRVHSHLLKGEKIPPALVGKKIWKHRFEEMCGFERYLGRNGIIVRKVFLHLSREEQRKRFLARLERPEKHWKFSMSDVLEREHWDKYMDCYEDMIRNTATTGAPWYVVPADHKWFSQLVVAAAVVDALKELKLTYPKVDADRNKELQEARRMLETEEV